ncbi:replication-relaxation family protein [Erythrobacter sp. HKB08]|uniref:replication-relaxation family protein n=1 Tax=Erythrobacter sp. HKB08 TaxID=2502843 RepID=UPI001008A43B|nr:replication-relaxation family protein [Erythrobacter sp. HKB08]
MSPKPKFDALGRRRRTKPTATGKRITPQPRDLLWFEKIAEHGPLPSSFLLAFAKDTHASEKRAKERLTDLFNEDCTPHTGAYLTRPAQQFRTLDARYNQLVYDLSPASVSALRKSGSAIRPARSGPWQHSLMVSCITASIELACNERDDINFVPQSKILARAGASLRWTTEICDPDSGASYEKDLLPDAVFGLEYMTSEGKRYRFYAVEADRATEPLRSAEIHRKSFLRHLLQYEGYIEGAGYQEHLGLTAPMMVLNVTTSEERMRRMLALTAELFPEGNSYQLFQVWNAFGTDLSPPRPRLDFIRSVWIRPSLPSISLSF